MEQELERRASDKAYLSKQELYYLVYQIVDAARNFDRVEEKVGDIRPSQILLDDNKKRAKLVNYFSSPGQLTGLEKAIELKERPYLGNYC